MAFYRSVLRDRLAAVLLFSLAIVCILFPELTTLVAHRLGVGRGTDLIVYLFIVAAMFLFILVHSRIASLERAQTQLVRQIAMQNASKPKAESAKR